MADFGVKVSANVEVDREGFISQLQALAKGITVKVGVEVDEASKASFLNSLKNIVPKTPVKVKVEPEAAGKNSIAQQVSKMAGKVDVGKTMQVNKAGLTSVSKQVQSELNRAKLNLKLNKIDADAPIAEVGKQLKEEISDVSTGNGVKTDVDTLGASVASNTMEQTAESINRVAEGTNKAKSATQEWAAQLRVVDGLQSQLDKKYKDALIGKNRITDSDRLEILTKEYQGLTDKIEKLKKVSNGFNYQGLEDATRGVRELDKAIDELRLGTGKYKDLSGKAFEDQIVSAKKLNTLYQQMDRFLKSNTKAIQTSQGKEIQKYMDQLATGGVTTTKYNEMQSGFSKFKKELTEAGKLGRTFSDRVLDAYQRFGGWSIITNSLGHAVMAVRDMITNVVNLDTAMTELKKVTDETDATYEKFFSGAADRAREIGATVTDTITATADFARLGYDIDQASALADAALVYKNVGDGIENISDASDSIISTMMAFEDLEGRDPMRIVDAFNELGKLIA